MTKVSSEQLSFFDMPEVDNGKDLEVEYESLKKTLNYHCERYYNDDEPEISDHDYDQLSQRLKAIEKEHPEMITPDSPTQRVGWKAQKGVLVKHNVPMLSLQDVFSKEDVDDFVNELKAQLGDDTEFLVETKIDGLSMALRYEDGKLVTAVTRGDGITEGEDVTMNAKVISDVVKQMKEPLPYIEIRGEVYMTRAAFDACNEACEAEGKKVFANPRNCAAGTLRQIDTRITKERNLSLFIFNVQEVRGTTFLTHTDGYDYLKRNGVKVIDLYYKCKTAEEVWDAITAIGNARGTLPYDIDGAVVKLNNLADREKLGATIKFPRWAVAYKYPPEEKETKLLDIEVGVGRTGRVTPVAVFEPISLCGTSVQRATLHNQDFIDELDIGIGDTLVVYKSGEIIPKVKGVNKLKRPSNWQRFKLPDVCPICGEKLIREEDAADVKCVNPNCPGTLQNRIINFVSRDCMDIKGFGSEYIKALVEGGYIKNVADIFELKNMRDRLLEEKIFGLEKNTDKILAAIDAAKTETPAEKVLASLGIPNVGKATAKDLMRSFNSIDKLALSSEEELIKVDSIGGISAAGIYNYFRNEANMELVSRLKAYGLNFESTNQVLGNALSGMSVCITGTLPSMSRDEAVSLIEANGGKAVSSVSSKTSMLLAGENAGSNRKKAEDLGIRIIDEAEFLSMLS